MNSKATRRCVISIIVIITTISAALYINGPVFLSNKLYLVKSVNINGNQSRSSSKPEQGLLLRQSEQHKVILPSNYHGLFYNADLQPIINASLNGAPFAYLPEYRNPCWEAIIVPKGKQLTSSNYYPKYMLRKYIERLRSGNNRRLRCLPLVHLVGFPKCGTSDFYMNLIKHPDIAQSRRKEPLFWTYGRIGPDARSVPFSITKNISSYVNVFDVAAEEIHRNSHKITVDASTARIYYMDGWRNIPGHENMSEPLFTQAETLKALIPNARIIIMLRDPTERSYSRYRHYGRSSRRPHTPELFHKFSEGFVAEMKACLQHNTLRQCVYNDTHFTTWTDHIPEQHSLFLRSSLYYVYINDWLKVFPRDQVHFIQSEKYYEKRSPILKSTYRFLGLNPEAITPETYVKLDGLDPFYQNVKHRPMLNATRTLLEEFFYPYNRQLAELLGDEKYTWLDIKPT